MTGRCARFWIPVQAIRRQDSGRWKRSDWMGRSWKSRTTFWRWNTARRFCRWKAGYSRWRFCARETTMRRRRTRTIRRRRVFAQGFFPAKIFRPLRRRRQAGLRLLSDEAWQQTAHGSEGLWSKAMKAAREKGSLEEIIGAVKSRRYPRTRIQRLLLCAFLKISQEDLQLPVCHVRALAFDDTGKALLRRMRAEGQLPVVNAGEKPPVSALFDLEVRAGRLYPLFCRSGTVPDGNASGRRIPDFRKGRMDLP